MSIEALNKWITLLAFTTALTACGGGSDSKDQSENGEPVNSSTNTGNNSSNAENSSDSSDTDTSETDSSQDQTDNEEDQTDNVEEESTPPETNVVVTPSIFDGLTANGCAAGQEPGTWVNVTPPGMKGGYTNRVLVDPVRPTDYYVTIDNYGLLRSTDCGATWTETGSLVGTFRNWGEAIAPDMDRDPNLPPTIYQVSNGDFYKSTDGGLSFSRTFTNISYIDSNGDRQDISHCVGGDVGAVYAPDQSEPDFVIIGMHGLPSCEPRPEISGVYYSLDGGDTWTSVPGSFSFQPHDSLLHAFDRYTWLVTPNTLSNDKNIYRTTNGKDWSIVGTAPTNGLLHPVGTARSGDLVYTGNDYNGSSVYRTEDFGLTWQSLGWGGFSQGVAVTEKNVYSCDGRQAVIIWSAPLDDDTSATPTVLSHTDISLTTKIDNGLQVCGSFSSPVFDGEHYTFIGAFQAGGLWRYVEP